MTTTPEIDALIARHREAERAIQQLHVEQSTIGKEIDALRMSGRPTYPTDAQREGMKVAAQRIRDHVAPDSHHGDPTPTYEIVVDGARGWLCFRHHAPHAFRGWSKLWDYTVPEVNALVELVQAEGFEIASKWRNDEGLSVTVRLR